MPKPRKNESRESFVARCIPIVMKEGTAKNNKQATAVCNSMWEKGRTTNNKSSQTLEHIAFNAAACKAVVRNESLEGRDHYVVPMVMLTEGVHAGNKGPLYYPKEELSKSPSAWDHKPIVVYHPDDDKTACRPTIINSQKVGIILNTEWDKKGKKLKAEAWIDKKRADKVDIRISESIEQNRVMELSTGLLTENEMTPGQWGIEAYEGIARNYRPDHLALLPDKRGACSVDDGAGLLKNEMSFSNIHSSLALALEEKHGYSAYVQDVFDGFFIYSRKNKLFRMDYGIKNDEIEVEGEPEEVVRVTEYRTKEGEVVGNEESGLTDEDDVEDNSHRGLVDSSDTGEEEMPAKKTKKDLVDGLISNSQTQWTEKNRKFLEKFKEDELELMNPVMNDGDEDEAAHPTMPPDGKKPGQNKDNQMVKDLPPDEVSDQPQQGAQQEKEGKKSSLPKMHFNELLQNADPHTRAFIERGIAAHKRQRNELIDTITSNKENRFTKEQLAKFETDDLENMAVLARREEPKQPNLYGYDYSGAAGSMVENEDEEEGLPMPVMNFGDEG
jgi:hypothetical protein